MRQSLDHFIEKITRQRFDEDKGHNVDFYSIDDIMRMIIERYEIVFNHMGTKHSKDFTGLIIKVGDHNIEELWDINAQPKRLLATRNDDICKYLEKLYIYIITNKSGTNK